MSLQLRLTLLSFLLTAGAVAVLAAGAYLVARDRVYGSVDSSLTTKANAVGGSVEPVSDLPLTVEDINASRRSLDGQAAFGADFRVLSLDLDVLFTAQPSWREPPSASLEGNGYETVQSGGESYRVFRRPLFLAGQLRGYVEVRTSLAQADQSLAEMWRVLLLGAVTVSGLTAVLAYVVTGRAIEPVRELALLAADVEKTADFSKRLPADPSSREIRVMAQTFNRMISRVERLIGSQRTFLSDTSHELRRPLTILRANLDVLNDPGLSEADRPAVVCEMQEVAESMSTLLAELLQLSRQDEGLIRLQPINLSSLCSQRVSSIAQAYPQHDYECDLQPDVWVEADAEVLSRALDNLLQNAAIYTPGSGRIAVSLSRRDGQVILQIGDNGSGMGPDEVEHAFDRFYRGAHSRSVRPDGLGLGLAIVKQAADRHGGAVTIESEPDEGTKVILRIPLLSG